MVYSRSTWDRVDVLTGAFDVDEVYVVSSRVDDRPECHGVGNLAMEPDVLVRRKEPAELGPDDSNDVAQHGDQD